MLSNIFKIAFRHLLHHPFYAVISIFGLAISISSALLMLVYLNGEWNYDRFHQAPEQIHRVVFDSYMEMGSFATTPLPVGPALESDFPEVAAMTRAAMGLESLVQYEDQKFFETLAFVDTGLTDVFNIPFVAGTPSSSLDQPNKIIISETYAKKYFGTKDPIGQTLTIGSSGKLNSTVSGVFKDFPQNSHIRFDLALPFSTFEKVYGPASLWRQMPANYTYIRIHPNTEIKTLQAKIPQFVENHVGDQLEDWEESYQISFQPLLDIHLYSEYGREIGKGNLQSLYLLGIIAIVVLIIAIINYINYATARFTKRMKEVGIRKIIGANRSHLILQFIGETFLVVLISGVVAVGLAELLLPLFNMASGKVFQPEDLHQPYFYTILTFLIIFISLVAGLFPAIFLASFQPYHIIKGQLTKLSVANVSRKGLIVFQFTTSITLLTATFVVWQQMNFVRESIRPDKDERIAVVQLNSQLSDKFDLLKGKLTQIQGVEYMSGGSNIPTFYGDSWPVRVDLGSQPVQMENYAIQDDFIEAMGYTLIAGRSLSSKLASDVDHGFVLNETAVRMLGFNSPKAALEQTILWGSEKKKEGQVVGVVKDFHFQKLQSKVEPAILQFAPYSWMRNNFAAIRFQSQNLPLLRTQVQSIVEEISPAWHADVRLLDDNFVKLHEKDEQLGRVFGLFAGLAIITSCLGLLGLATFSAARRTKEIGIRKVLGASIYSIIHLLSMEFLKLVVLSLVLAIPLAWFFMHQWLENFAYRIDIQWWYFILTGLVALIVAGITVGFQAMKVASANPVEALRTE